MTYGNSSDDGQSDSPGGGVIALQLVAASDGQTATLNLTCRAASVTGNPTGGITAIRVTGLRVGSLTTAGF